MAAEHPACGCHHKHIPSSSSVDAYESTARVASPFQVKWRLSNGTVAHWISDSITLDAVTALGLHDLFVDEDKEFDDEEVNDSSMVRAASGLSRSEEMPESRLDGMWDVRKQPHALCIKLRPGNTTIAHSCSRTYHIFVRKPSSQVMWESPLITCQRAEGFVLSHSKHRQHPKLRRFHPIYVYNSILQILEFAQSHASAFHAAALSSRIAYEFQYFAASARALLDQFHRVSSGGEEWIRAEQLAKLERLRTMAAMIKDKSDPETPLTPYEESVLLAFENGIRHLEGDNAGTSEAADVPEEVGISNSQSAMGSDQKPTIQSLLQRAKMEAIAKAVSASAEDR